MSALLDLGDLEPPCPTICTRTDGIGIFYAGQVNNLFGEPEAGKTFVADCAAVEVLNKGNSVLMIDLDHNGPQSTIKRLLDLGAREAHLRDPQRYRYTEPDDDQQLLAIVNDAKVWKPTLTVVDSMGELLPLFGASSNSPDDFTRVHTIVLKPLAKSGSAVIVIDHLAKNADSKVYGSSGTAAKKRAIGGSSLRVTAVEAFTPGSGGKAHLTINKDRHGGLRANSPAGDKEPLAATFHLIDNDGDLSWALYPARDGERADINPVKVTDDDLQALRALEPPPRTVRDVKARLQWATSRATAVLKAWRDTGSISAPQLPVDLVPRSSTPTPGNTGTLEQAVCRICSTPLLAPVSRALGVCGKTDLEHVNARAAA
ncbi:AAA family ATPase [Cryobacterium sp. RTS3]|uniref:AAA family ATPase n=1 Tax=Cryobacterium sp. RTS3 TaxID=3048643 RepID=UPI002B23715D|nr:AAA family ATPase [Cryobacterium sp. RTS3]